MANQGIFSHKGELENTFLLRGVDLESIQGLLEDCPVTELKSGQVLMYAGQSNHFLYLLLSGRLRVHLQLEEDPLVILEPGEFVGELSLIDGQPTSAYVLAHEDCRLLKVGENTMWSLVDFCPSVARNILLVLAQRLRHGNTIITTSKQMQSEYERSAAIDALTGLYRRSWLDSRLAVYMERCRGSELPLSMLLIAIDHLDQYKEAHGPQASDRVIYTIARILRNTCNQPGGFVIVDGDARGMRPSELIARYREDDFTVLLPDTDGSTGEEIGESVRSAVAAARIHSSDGRIIPSVTVSVAVTDMTAGDTLETLVASAEAVLDRAKKGGGNVVLRADRSS